MDFRTGKIFTKILKKTCENEWQKVVSNGFSARQTMSTLKCHRNFRPKIYLINFRLLNSNIVLLTIRRGRHGFYGRGMGKNFTAQGRRNDKFRPKARSA